MILLQAIGCYCYWDIHLIRLTEHVHAGRHNGVCVERSLAWVASSSPATGAGAGAGRGWRIDADGGLAGEWGGSGAGLRARSRPCSYEGETN